MYKNGSNDYGQNEGRERSQTIGQKGSGNGLGVDSSQLKMQKTLKEENKKGAVGQDNFAKSSTMGKSKKDMKDATLGWNFDDESQGRTLKQSSMTLSKTGNTGKGLNQM